MSNKLDAVIAEVHVGAVDEERGRAEAAAFDHLLGGVEQHLLVFRFLDLGEERIPIHPGLLDHGF